MSNENGFMAPSQQLPFEQGKATTRVPFNPPTPKKKKNYLREDLKSNLNVN